MKNALFCSFGALIMTVAGAGCSTVPVPCAPLATGETALLEYVCRLGDGSLAASNRVDEAAGNRGKKSEIYVQPRKPEPVSVIAGKGLLEDRPISVRSFEDEIAVQLAKKIVGLSTGVSNSVEIRGDGSLAADGQSHKLPMATVRTRLKELHLDRASYRAKTGKEPQAGQAYSLDPLIPGEVVEVQGDDVHIRSSAVTGTEVTTPYGKGVIRETAENYEIVISPRLGSLLRTGPIVGRISQVNERQFVIDYSDPFGGETLNCSVRLERRPEGRGSEQEKIGK